MRGGRCTKHRIFLENILEAISLTALCSVLRLIILQNYSCKFFYSFFCQQKFLLAFRIFNQVKKNLQSHQTPVWQWDNAQHLLQFTSFPQKLQAWCSQPGCFFIAFPQAFRSLRPTASKAPHLSNESSKAKHMNKNPQESYPLYPYI